MFEFVPLDQRLHKRLWHPFKLPPFTLALMQDIADGYWHGVLRLDGKHHERIVAKLKATQAREDVSEEIRERAALALRSISDAIRKKLEEPSEGENES